MASLLDLADRMDKLSAKIDESASKVAVKAALDMVRYLAKITPVDTSQAISNWQVTLDSPVNSFIGPHFMGNRGSTYTESSEQTIKSAENLLANKKPGQVIYIVNNAPYIIDLNRGSSKQHPGGFIDAAIVIGRNSAAKISAKGALKYV